VKDKFISLYFDIAERVSQLSYAKRLKVGAIIVKDDRILSYGYNGTPSGFDNVCELHIPEQIDIDARTVIEAHTITKPEVIHAEMNAIAKVARHNDSCQAATIFITHSPCVECAKLILQSGINKVYYKNDYRSTAGIDLLRKSHFSILVTKWDSCA
jgi:dCMP deaminase